ncbi:hypothetical protein G7057_08310 [Jeotgalibaca arthritidis]|uniref:Galactokinase N-terminal domain-containing protein n=1 Tax=Jeotgalibaca arthritidis TaxID=1868794 RepID=A0A6G7KB08_9LACT|nr:hypothetical protein G7057_08310 [Jeotgalibaca arthritidis]
MKELIQTFNHRYKETDVRAVKSPLRICPIGAHSDHQGGLVTGMTLDASVIWFIHRLKMVMCVSKVWTSLIKSCSMLLMILTIFPVFGEPTFAVQ